MPEETQPFFEEIMQLVRSYVKDRILLLKIQAAEKTAKLVSFLLALIVFSLLFFFILMFLSMMAGYYFASLTGSLFYGFGIVTAFYLILAIMLVLLRKKIHRAIGGVVVKVFFDQQGDDSDEDAQ